MQKLLQGACRPFHYVGQKDGYNIYQEQDQCMTPGMQREIPQTQQLFSVNDMYPRFDELQKYYQQFKLREQSAKTTGIVKSAFVQDPSLQYYLEPQPSIDFLMAEYKKLQRKDNTTTQSENCKHSAHVDAVFQQVQREIDERITQLAGNVTNCAQNTITGGYVPRAKRENAVMDYNKLGERAAREKFLLEREQEYQRVRAVTTKQSVAPIDVSLVGVLSERIRRLEERLAAQPSDDLVKQMVEQTVANNKLLCDLVRSGCTAPRPRSPAYEDTDLLRRQYNEKINRIQQELTESQHRQVQDQVLAVTRPTSTTNTTQAATAVPSVPVLQKAQDEERTHVAQVTPQQNEDTTKQHPVMSVEEPPAAVSTGARTVQRERNAKEGTDNEEYRCYEDNMESGNHRAETLLVQRSTTLLEDKEYQKMRSEQEMIEIEKQALERELQEIENMRPTVPNLRLENSECSSDFELGQSKPAGSQQTTTLSKEDAIHRDSQIYAGLYGENPCKLEADAVQKLRQSITSETLGGQIYASQTEVAGQLPVDSRQVMNSMNSSISMDYKGILQKGFGNSNSSDIGGKRGTTGKPQNAFKRDNMGSGSIDLDEDGVYDPAAEEDRRYQEEIHKSTARKKKTTDAKKKPSHNGTDDSLGLELGDGGTTRKGRPVKKNLIQWNGSSDSDLDP